MQQRDRKRYVILQFNEIRNEKINDLLLGQAGLSSCFEEYETYPHDVQRPIG